jgi:predicted phage replisome organizer
MKMSENKKFYWLKLHDDFFRSKRIKKLRKLGSDFVIIYLKMQLLSLRNNGILEYSGVENNFSDEIALDIDEDPDKVQLTISYLQSCGLLECKDNTEFFLPYVEKCTGKETQSTIRSRRFRENKEKALHCNADATLMQRSCNAYATKCNTEKEKEIEKDTDIEKEKNKRENFAPAPFFNAEKAFDDTFNIYPKKDNYASAWLAWMDLLIPVIDSNRKEVAIELAYGLKMYLADYQKKNPDDEDYRYIPKFDKWIRENANYWIGQYEKSRKDNCS